MKADLHCHTKLSDGTMGIDDLITLAKNSGVDTVAIADCDCLAGNSRAEVIGRRNGVSVIPAVELSCTDIKRRRSAQLICYMPDTPEGLEGLCKRNSDKRLKSAKMMIAKLGSRYPINADFFVKCCGGSTNIFPQHIMQALMECGYSTSAYGEVYDSLFTKSSPDNILTPTVYPEPAKVLEEIHAAGGIAVLSGTDGGDNFELLEELTDLGLDGVEVWHPNIAPETEEKLIKYAKKAGLLMTGGSGFRGAYNDKPLRLGDYGPDEDCLGQLLTYKAKKRRKQKKQTAEA